MDFQLRPETPEDTPLLFEIFSHTHGAHLAALPDPLLRIQFEAQRAHYRTTYPTADLLIITKGSQPAGRLCVDRARDTIHLIDIALLPACQGQGLGTAVLESLLVPDHTVTLNVQDANPARRLYERLGFVILEDLGLYLRMEWYAARQAAHPNAPARVTAGAGRRR